MSYLSRYILNNNKLVFRLQGRLWWRSSNGEPNEHQMSPSFGTDHCLLHICSSSQAVDPFLGLWCFNVLQNCADGGKSISTLMFLGSEWSEEVPGEPAQPLFSHPGPTHQQGFGLFSASGLPCATYWDHLSNSTQYPCKPAEVPSLIIWSLHLHFHLHVLLLEPGLSLLRPPDGATRAWWPADSFIHPSRCTDR